MNRLDAALLLAKRYPGGIESLAPRMGIRPDTLRKELTRQDGYKFGTDEEELLMELCEGAGVSDPLAPLTACAVNHGAMLLPLPAALVPNGGAPLERLAEEVKDFAEFTQAQAGAWADARISDNELRDLERKAGALVAVIQQSLADAKRQHDEEAARRRGDAAA
jgi:hypothetical protein